MSIFLSQTAQRRGITELMGAYRIPGPNAVLFQGKLQFTHSFPLIARRKMLETLRLSTSCSFTRSFIADFCKSIPNIPRIILKRVS